MMAKAKKHINRICEMLEMVCGVLVMIGIVIAIIAMVSRVAEFKMLYQGTLEIGVFLEHVFNIVIGIEFLQMLCRPNSDNVLETLIFLVARHMIINITTPLEDLILVVTVCMLCIVRRGLHINKLRVERETAAYEAEHGKMNNED